MKLYLIVTGLLFALLAGAHLVLTIAHWERWPDPHFVFQGPGIATITAGLAGWAGWLLLARSQRPGARGQEPGTRGQEPGTRGQ